MPTSALMRDAGKETLRGKSTALGCLVGAVLWIARLLMVVVPASASLLAVAPASAAAQSSSAQRSATHSDQNPGAIAAHASAADRPRGRMPRKAQGTAPTGHLLLVLGSGYNQPGGSALVRTLQRRLAVAGFDPGPVDGLYGPRTEAAVASFQAGTGLPVDGMAGRDTLSALTSPVPTLHRDAGYGSGGSRPVRELQRLLVRAGYDAGRVDGLYGPRTEQAVRRFQTAHGLPADGVAHPQTSIALRTLVGTLRRARPGTGHRLPPTAKPRRFPRTGTGHRHPPSRTAHPTPRARPKSASRGRVHVPARTAQPKTRPSGGSSIQWLGMLVAGLLITALVIAALLIGTANIRRRGGPQPAAAEDVPAITGSRNGLSDQDRAPQPPTAEAEGDAEAAFGRGVRFEEDGDLAAAEAAYRRADEQGHAAAASNLGTLLERGGELQAARAAYRRADERGDPVGAFNLGVLLEELGDLSAAEAAYRRADGRGHAAAASNLGVLLEVRGDAEGAEAAYRRADERGDPNGTFNLAVLLEERDDPRAAEAAYRRAVQRGSAEVANAARAALVGLPAASAAPQDSNGGDVHVG